MKLSSDLIRPVQPADTDRLTAIYNHYVAETIVTFDERPLSNADMHQRIKSQARELPWFVLLLDDNVTGYACAAPWHERAAYAHSVEAAIYLAPECTGHGYGSQLLSALLETLEASDIHCVLGQIALPNDASVALVEKHGFVQAGPAAGSRPQVRSLGRRRAMAAHILIIDPTSHEESCLP